MELTFRTEKKKIGLRYLQFLPKELRSLGAWSILLNLVALLLPIIFYSSLQKEIPLFYSLPSDQQLIDKKFIFILPLISTLMNMIHFLIAYFEKEINHNILRMFIQLTMLLQLIALAILLRIIIIIL